MGAVQACTTCTTALRTAPSASAQRSAAIDGSEPSTPTTTRSRSRPRRRLVAPEPVIAVGAVDAHDRDRDLGVVQDCWLTDPRSRPRNPPSPRAPTTSRSRRARRRQQARRRQVAHHAAHHRRCRLGAQRRLDRRGQGGVGVGVAVVGVEATAAVRVVLVEQVPHEHGHQVAPVQRRLAGGPAQRAPSRGPTRPLRRRSVPWRQPVTPRRPARTVGSTSAPYMP